MVATLPFLQIINNAFSIDLVLLWARCLGGARKMTAFKKWAQWVPGGCREHQSSSGTQWPPP